MQSTAFPQSREAIAEAERIVAWLRLPAVVLIALGQSLDHPNPRDGAFVVSLAIFATWSIVLLVYVYSRSVGPRFALIATGVDIIAISVLAVLSGGAFSNARFALFLVPVAVAFRFQPSITAAAAVVTTAAYVLQAVAHPTRAQPGVVRFIVTQAGFLAWVGVACVLLSIQLARRTELVARLGEARNRLLADVEDAEQRERKTLAESLHDHAIQNLLSVRHELEEAGETAPQHPALARADAALVETVDQLRDAVFELHPYVFDQAGLEAALRSAALRAATRGGLELQLDLHCRRRHPEDQLIFGTARELLANVVQHANATHVAVRLTEDDGAVAVVVEDDGTGFQPERLGERLAGGHVGLASQRVRVEAAGGSMTVLSHPGEGTRVEVRVPVTHAKA